MTYIHCSRCGKLIMHLADGYNAENLPQAEWDAKWKNYEELVEKFKKRVICTECDEAITKERSK